MNSLQRTLDWFKKVIPTKPSEMRNAFHTQLGVHFEEVGEMVNELSTTDLTTATLLTNAQNALDALAKHLKANEDVIFIEPEDIHDFVDAICDQLVTATGCAAYVQADLVGALNEVNRSNWSKFVDGEPIFDENRKVKKGPNYIKADLNPFLPA